jgi:hypothetical protein
MGGAGPDAMEAAGVGPWLSGRSEGDTAAAIAGLAQVPKYVEHDWIKTGIEGREKYPRMLPGENLAITTYAYAYSPPMPYADVYASFSTDMIRGYEMLTRTKVRLIMPGGKGTFLEKSMDDLLRTYNKCCSDTVTIFFDSKFWKKNLSPIMLSENLHFADTPEEVISHVLDHMSLAASQSSHPECANDDTAQSNSYRI